MGLLINETGNKYGRLTVLSRAGSTSSKGARWLCECDCGWWVIVNGEDIRTGRSTSCGCFKKEKLKNLYSNGNALNWNGGKIQRKDGYIQSSRKGHPRANKRGYVLEHILVMEEILGSSLPVGAVVHHINNIRNDNRPENLVLYESHSEHQREHRLNKKHED
jgi:hypothetical protein